MQQTTSRWRSQKQTLRIKDALQSEMRREGMPTNLHGHDIVGQTR